MTKKQKCIKAFENKIHSLVFPWDVKISDVFGEYPTNYEYKIFDYIKCHMMYQFMNHYAKRHPKHYALYKLNVSERESLEVYKAEGGSDFFKSFKYDVSKELL